MRGGGRAWPFLPASWPPASRIAPPDGATGDGGRSSTTGITTFYRDSSAASAEPARSRPHARMTGCGDGATTPGPVDRRLPDVAAPPPAGVGDDGARDRPRRSERIGRPQGGPGAAPHSPGPSKPSSAAASWRVISTRDEWNSLRVVWRPDATRAFPRLCSGARSRLLTRDELHSSQVGISLAANQSPMLPAVKNVLFVVLYAVLLIVAIPPAPARAAFASPETKRLDSFKIGTGHPLPRINRPMGTLQAWSKPGQVWRSKPLRRGAWLGGTGFGIIRPGCGGRQR